MGALLRGHLDAAADRFAEIGDVRGRGLMLGAEMVDTSADPDGLGAHPPDADLAEAIQSECFDRGLIVERGGREGATVRFLPPLIVSKAQVEDIGRIFRESVEAAVRDANSSP
jgi:diaminobutyrate-2-oxoglutarate transaminase